MLQHTVFHYRDAAAQGHGLDLVVRDVDAGDTADLVQALDLGAHFHSQLGIEIGQRFIEKKELRVACQRPSHGHALALATRELRRSAIEQVLNLQHGGHLGDALHSLRFGYLAHFQRETHVFCHAHGGVEGVALEHHGNVALGWRHANHVLASNAHLAFRGVLQTRNDVEQGRFAATRGTHQNQELSGSDVDIDALQHFDRVRTLAKNLADACNAERCCHPGAYPFTAPAVRPLTKYCPASTYTSMVGSAAITAAAMSTL